MARSKIGVICPNEECPEKGKTQVVPLVRSKGKLRDQFCKFCSTRIQIEKGKTGAGTRRFSKNGKTNRVGSGLSRMRYRFVRA